MVAARPAAFLVALVLGSAALTGCGLSDEVTLPTAVPSASLERPTPTRTLPSERPSASPPTGLPSATPSAEPPTPTESATPEPTSEAPTSQEPTSEEPEESPSPTRTLSQAATSIPPSEPAATGSPTPEQSEPPEQSESAEESEAPTTTPEATESPSQEPSESPSPTSAGPTESSSPPVAESASASAAADESGSSSLPLWLGLGALVAAGAALAWFLVAGSKRRGWDERLDVERAQGQWIVAELVPALTNPATPPQQAAQHWAEAQPTVEQLAASLAELVADAPDEGRGATARSIADATAEVRRALASDLALRTGTAGIPADSPALLASAQAVQGARDRLAAAIAVPA